MLNFKKLLLKSYILPIILAVIVGYINPFIQIYIADRIGYLFDIAVEGKTEVLISSIPNILFVFMAIILGRKTILIFLQLYKRRVNYKVIKQIFKSFIKGPITNIKKYRIGEILTRLGSDFEKVDSASNSITKVMVGLLSSITYIVYISLTNFSIALIMFFLGIIPVVSPMFFARLFAINYDRMQNIEEKIQSYQEETINNIIPIKFYDLYKKVKDKYRDLLEEQRLIDIKVEKLGHLQSSIDNGVKMICEIGLYSILGWAVYSGIINVGNLVTLLLVSKNLNHEMYIIFNQYRDLKETNISYNRIKELLVPLQIKKENSEDNLKKISSINKIDLRKVSFGYEKNNWIIRDLDLLVKKGEKIIILGANGSGKSTLIKLLLGIYKDYQGEILINNTPLPQVEPKSYAQNISWIPQDISFIDKNILYNIKRVTSVSENNIKGWIKKYGLSLYDNDINTLSGGQAQKIYTIMGFLKPSNLIVMDEPTNNMDRKGINILKGLIEKTNKTCIVISHNNKLVPLFDYIYTLDNGVLVKNQEINQVNN